MQNVEKDMSSNDGFLQSQAIHAKFAGMAVNEASLEAVRRAMRAKAPRVPTHYDRVHKEECAFSFDTAFSPAGIYINLANWQAYGHDYMQLDHQRSGNCLYLHETWKKVSKLAISSSTCVRH